MKFFRKCSHKFLQSLARWCKISHLRTATLQICQAMLGLWGWHQAFMLETYGIWCQDYGPPQNPKHLWMSSQNMPPWVSWLRRRKFLLSFALNSKPFLTGVSRWLVFVQFKSHLLNKNERTTQQHNTLEDLDCGLCGRTLERSALFRTHGTGRAPMSVTCQVRGSTPTRWSAPPCGPDLVERSITAKDPEFFTPPFRISIRILAHLNLLKQSKDLEEPSW